MVLTRATTAAVATQEPASPLRVVYVRYVDTVAGHEEMGRTVGAACREAIRAAVGSDPEVKLCLKIVETPRGKRVFAEYLRVIEALYPKYLAELRGIRTATQVPLKALLCSCLRQVSP